MTVRVLSGAGCSRLNYVGAVQVRTASFNLSMVDAVAILIGNEFHVAIVRGEKLYFII